MLENDYAVTYSKTGMIMEFQFCIRGIFVMKAKVKEYGVFFNAMMNHIPNNIVRNSKLINLKENHDINNMSKIHTIVENLTKLNSFHGKIRGINNNEV